MMPSPLNLLVRVLHRYGFQSRNASKRALVSYVATLPFWNERYFLRSHNAKLTSYLICRVLNTLGYTVDLRSCDDLDVPTDRSYDFFFGHTSTFLQIKNKIALTGKAVLLVTGSSPEFGNAAQSSRAEDLFQRRGIRLPVCAENIVPPAREWHSAADHILMLGNDFVRDTWYPEFNHKYTQINNVSALNFDLGSERSPSNYLFLSSTGQVHRGLDVLLDVFAERSEHLHICSSVLQEPDFVAAYRKELFECPNIHVHGFINISSMRFYHILSVCRFVILPSCSEGQSSSVVNAMFRGLLPIVTQNAGLPSVSRCGFEIEEISPVAIQAVLDRAAKMSIQEYQSKRDALQDYVRKFSPQEFEETVTKFFCETVGL